MLVCIVGAGYEVSDAGPKNISQIINMIKACLNDLVLYFPLQELCKCLLK